MFEVHINLLVIEDRTKLKIHMFWIHIEIDPATGELDIGSWYVTHPTPPEHSQAGSLKQTLLVFICIDIG